MANVNFMVQIQIPIIAGDIVEARKKASEILKSQEVESKATFFQVVSEVRKEGK